MWLLIFMYSPLKYVEARYGNDSLFQGAIFSKTAIFFARLPGRIIQSVVMFCAIWYHLYNLKNVKNTHGGVLLLVKL